MSRTSTLPPLERMLKKPAFAAETEGQSDSLKDDLQKFDTLSSRLFVMQERAGVAFGAEKSRWEEQMKSVRGEIRALTRAKGSIQALLRARYHRLDHTFLLERDQAGLPFLLPIPIVTDSTDITIRYAIWREGVEAMFQTHLFLPYHWPALFQYCYADLARRYISLEEIQKVREKLLAQNEKGMTVDVKLSVKLEGLIPKEELIKIKAGETLVGERNVFLIVDCKGLKVNKEYTIIPNTDPVAVAIWQDEIYHLADFDTTPAEALFALSSKS